jgi:outer membrane lipopolysaccharide assembly protein LptE/RlpB
MRIYMTIALLLILLAGCYYTFTPNLPPGIKSVAVPIFENNTLNYGLETLVTSKVVDEFVKDGNLQVKDVRKADSIMHGTVTNYVQEAAAYTVGEAIQKYRLTMTVSISFEDRVSGEILWSEPNLTYSVTYFPTVSQGNAETEQQAQQRLAQEIAQEIVRRTIEGW